MQGFSEIRQRIDDVLERLREVDRALERVIRTLRGTGA